MSRYFWLNRRVAVEGARQRRNACLTHSLLVRWNRTRGRWRPEITGGSIPGWPRERGFYAALFAVPRWWELS